MQSNTIFEDKEAKKTYFQSKMKKK